MNRNLLRTKMILKGDTNETLAEYLGLHPTSLSMKLNEYHGREFTQSEIRAIRERYDLTDAEVTQIFFA